VTPALFLAAVLASAVPAPGAQESPAATPAPDSVLARRLYFAALDRQAEFDYDSSLTLMRAARAADPSDLAIHDQVIWLTADWQPDGLATVRREYAALPDSPLVECLRSRLAVASDNEAAAAPALFELESRYPDEACPVVLLSRLLRVFKPEHEWKVRRLDYLARAVELAPGLPGARSHYAAALADEGRFDEADRAYAEAVAALQHPMYAIPLHMRRAGTLIVRGDVAEAEALRRAVEQAVERDGRPGVRFMYLRELGSFTNVPAQMLGSMDASLRAQAQLARDHGAWLWEWYVHYGQGMRLTNRGEPLAALAELDRAVHLADSVGMPGNQVRALYKRAAALVRTGRRGEAEQDLLRAVELIPRADSPYTEAETWHGLLHMYDDDGRLEDALRASGRFIDAAERMPHSPLRMSAWMDAGELRWKAGQHAAANEAFAGLVRVVDDYDELHAYAGQYFERTGDLAAARDYYERGGRSTAASADGLRALNWAGLARVYLALGALDSAEVMARRHDSAITEHSSVPILPTLLAERGRADEAIETAAAWAHSRLDAGAVQGAAAAHVLWAELLLRARRPADALEVAGRADSLARSIDDHSIAVEAARLRGLALEELGDSGAAITVLEEAARMANADGDVEAVLATHVALGRLLASQERVSEALEAWDVAARQAEATTANLDLDFDRVRYRERRLAPYEAALLALVEQGAESDPAALLAWSQRRKAAALRLVSDEGGLMDGAAAAVGHDGRSLRLAEGEVLLDYNLVGDLAFVLVVGSRGDVDLVRLEVTPDSIRSLVERVRAPFNSVYAGSVDLARIRFPREAASELFEAIVAPIRPLIDGAHRLLIVPDGPLHRLSFAGLVADADSPGRQARFLVEDFEILYMPSAAPDRASRDWARLGIETSRPAAVIAGSAPGTRREIETLASMWPGTVHGAEVLETKESALAELPARPAVLHVASHAIADDRDPYASHIRLAADSLADGLLHGAEIGLLDLDGSLVVLSACETVEGPLYAGEGLLGLQRSFAATGASGVLATLWPVGPSAADIVGFFYESLVEGDPPVTALQRAQLRMLESPETEHPFHWAGFVLQQPR
jgi:CHAT domain-containing protein